MTRNAALTIAAVAMLVATAAVTTRSRIFAALTRDHDHFVVHEADPRVHYEQGAETYAGSIASLLPEAIAMVEAGMGAPFARPITVYMCASQESLNAYIAAPPGSPIRGTAVRGAVYLAPSAFDWEGRDTHRASLTHELAHLYLAQKVGYLSRRRIPAWFHEGLANIIASSGGEGVSERDAVRAIREGRHLPPRSRIGVLERPRPAERGITHPMLHRQSQMFVSFLRASDPPAFRRLIRDVLSEGELRGPLIAHYGRDAPALWAEFVSGL